MGQQPLRFIVQRKPDIELVDLTSRINTINEIMEVTTKPIILDGDTGGRTEHFIYNVRTLERLGFPHIIVRIKPDLSKLAFWHRRRSGIRRSV